jgi:para-nitrobenzyl esterase
MALKWIRDNIRAFGGDPTRVSVMGESAGAKLTSALLVAPAAKGYFSQLILESGSVNCIRDTTTAKAIRQRVMDTLGIKRPEELLQMPMADLINAQGKVLGGAKGTNYFGPVIDGKTIKGDALQYVRTHPDKRLRVLLGTNKEEARGFMFADKRLFQPDSVVLYDWFGDNHRYIKAAYDKARLQHADTAAGIITLSRYMYQLHTYRLAKALAGSGRQVWMYSFDQRKNGLPAAHAEELAYVWYTPGNGAEPELATIMHQQWVDFIKGRPIWPRYDSRRTGIIFDGGSKITTLDDYEDKDHPTRGFILN